MKTLVMGGLRGNLAVAQSIQAALGAENVTTVVLGDLFGDTRDGALAVAGWLASQMANPAFHVLVGDEDIPVLWPDHWWSSTAVRPDWGPEVVAALGASMSGLRLVLHDQGVWYSHAGITDKIVTSMGGLTPETAEQANTRARAALDDGSNHPLLDVAGGVLTSNWRKSAWLPSVLQVLSHPCTGEPQGQWRHPNYSSGIVYVHGAGYGVVRNGEQVSLASV